MANNQYVNKVIYGGDTLIDLTPDQVTRADVLSGVTFHLPSGEPTTGTCTYDSDTSGATATASEILSGQTAFVNGVEVTGTMPDRTGAGGTISTVSQEYTIQQGFHDGSGKVSIDATEQAKIIASNILQGVTILGVTGTVSPSSDVQIESSKTATPTSLQQTILPSQGYDALAQVVVEPVPYTETDNQQGGKTVTIL